MASVSKPVASMVTYRLTFSKSGPTRWLGHLDIMRTFERAFRRCAVPVALSQGFNPRPKFRFVIPSAVGVAARADVVFVDIVQRSDDCPEVASWDPGIPIECLNATLPEGLRIYSAERVADAERRAALHAYRFAVYRMEFESTQQTAGAQLDLVIARLRQQPSAIAVDPVRGESREVPLDRYLVEMLAEATGDGTFAVWFTTTFGQDGTLRPMDVAALIAERLPGSELVNLERLALSTNPPDKSCTGQEKDAK